MSFLLTRAPDPELDAEPVVVNVVPSTTAQSVPVQPAPPPLAGRRADRARQRQRHRHRLEGGANDYVTKPFEFAELLARVRLRLADRLQDDAATTAESSLSLRDLRLDCIRAAPTSARRRWT